jgi:uncharacterized protein
MKKRIFLYFVVLLVLLPSVFSERHMILLAVEESVLGTKGTTAHLYMKTIEGKGQVFSATYPLTEMDTQISARLAKDIACKQTKHKCNRDFLYTIKSNSSIVGGPSGGAALTILTMSELQKQRIDEKISITGTINSGGIIGPVGGIKDKIKVAAETGLNAVLIPKGTRFIEPDNTTNVSQTNETFDLVEFGRKINIEVIEVSTVDEAYSYFIHQKYEEPPSVPEIDPKYRETMKGLAERLCNRSQNFEQEVGYVEGAVNLTEKADESLSNEEYYSAASYCFGANIKFLQAKFENLSAEEIKDKVHEIDRQKNRFAVPQYNSINDLQIFMVVKERLFETENWLIKTNESIEKAKLNKSYLEDARKNIAYANERLNSAIIWSQFFNDNDEKLIFDQENLKMGCIEKLAEAEERYQYVKIYFPGLVKEMLGELMQAKKDMLDEQYELCIFKSAKAKAEADVLLGAIGVKSEYLEQIIEEKLKVVGRILYEQKSFPVVAYSYYEYSDNLKESDAYSALLYAEYALELADLTPYIEFSSNGLELEREKKIVVVLLVLLLLAVSLWFINRK